MSLYDGVKYLRSKIQALSFVGFCDLVQNLNKRGLNSDSVLIEIDDFEDLQIRGGINEFSRLIKIYHIGTSTNDDLEFLKKEKDLISAILDDLTLNGNVDNVRLIGAITGQSTTSNIKINEIVEGNNGKNYCNSYQIAIDYCVRR